MLLDFLCSLLTALFCSLFSCHCFYSPFPFSWKIATSLSSQFVSCIESLKKIVKQKTRLEIPIALAAGDVRRLHIVDELSFRSLRLAQTIARIRETSMNTAHFTIVKESANFLRRNGLRSEEGESVIGVTRRIMKKVSRKRASYVIAARKMRSPRGNSIAR
ncbi:MAG: hypothetical protein WA655_24000 [Candidatus Korobacteraceae bacterium]